MLYYTVHDYVRTLTKLREAIALGKSQKDYPTVYSSLGLLGRTALELGQVQEAAEALAEIEGIIADGHPCNIGDETTFLEATRSRGLELSRVKRIAASLAPLCRDAEYKRRLQSLASS